MLRRLPTDGTYNRPCSVKVIRFPSISKLDSLPLDLSGGVFVWPCPSISQVIHFYSICFWLPVTRKGTIAQFYFFPGATSRVLRFMACVHTHASYAGVVCSMEDTPWGEVLGLCSTGR